MGLRVFENLVPHEEIVERELRGDFYSYFAISPGWRVVGVRSHSVVADCRYLASGWRPAGSLITCLAIERRLANLSETTRPPVVHLRKTASNLFPTTSVGKRFSVQHQQPPRDRFALTTSSNHRLVREHASNIWQLPKDQWSQVVISWSQALRDWGFIQPTAATLLAFFFSIFLTPVLKSRYLAA